MQDVTDDMLAFKEAVRHAWNTHFALCNSPMSPDVQEAFEEIERGFFRGIVLAPLGATPLADSYRKTPLEWLIIQPPLNLAEFPLQLADIDPRGNTRWSVPAIVQATQCVVFEFFDFFDWYPYGVVDLPFIRARIRELPSKSEAHGLMALIEQRYCRFLFTGYEET